MVNRKNNLKRVMIIIITSILVLVGGFFIYTLDYYRADDFAIETFNRGGYSVKNEKNIFIFQPDKEIESDTALIFYPGGKVEAIAYAPLLERLSQQGITCVLVKMPFNLSVFNVNAADNIYSRLPNIRNWYIGGHSLGGAMASSYVNKNSDKIKGLILLGAYPVGDSNIDTLAIFGSEDMVLDKTKLETTSKNIEIAGGNHAYFGNYGEQKGDGTATITRHEQQQETVDEIIKFVFGEI